MQACSERHKRCTCKDDIADKYIGMTETPYLQFLMPYPAVRHLHVLSVELLDVFAESRPVAMFEDSLVLLVGEERLSVLSLKVALVNAERPLYYFSFLKKLITSIILHTFPRKPH